jgi:hypothetical protein
MKEILYYPFIHHVVEFIFPTKWLLKWYSIMKCNFVFQINLYFKKEKIIVVYIIDKNLRLNFNIIIWKKY